MKVLLKKDISHLGIVGDVVNVSRGYARNYLVPNNLATEPTDSNMRALAEERAKAEERRRQMIASLRSKAEKLAQVEVTIAAAANEDGVLYGSVGRREIAEALNAEGHEVRPEQVLLAESIRHLDTVSVTVKLLDDISAEVKVWVVREKTGKESAEEGEESASDESESAN